MTAGRNRPTRPLVGLLLLVSAIASPVAADETGTTRVRLTTDRLELYIIALIGMAIVGGTGLAAVAGETKAKTEKAKGDMKADFEETKGEAKALTEEVKGNKTKAEMERAKGKVKGGGERVKGKSKEMKARVE